MLIDYQNKVERLVQDDAGKIKADDRDDAVTNAVRRYSKDRPRNKVSDLAPASANLLPLPTLWVTDFSTIVSLEYPIGDKPPTLIEPDRYGTYDDGTAVKIQLIDAIDTAKQVRATFTVMHSVSATEDTIPAADFEAVCCWAAAALCDQLATLYSGGTDSTIQADSVRTQSKAQEFAARAKTLRKRYTDELGIEDKRNVAAGTVVPLRNESSAGQTPLTHPMRRNWS